MKLLVVGGGGYAGSVSGNAAVAGTGKNFGDFGVLFQGTDDGMLTATATHNE